MSLAQSTGRIRLDVYRWYHRRSRPVEPDAGPPSPEDWGFGIGPHREPHPGGDDNVLLGVVEVPADADVRSMHAVRIACPSDPAPTFPGVGTSLFGRVLAYDIRDHQILDVAADPACAGLGITLVSDLREEAV